MGDLTEKQLSSELIHKGNFFNLYKDQIELPNKRKSEREYILHPGAVIIVPLFENGDTVLIRQYRYPLREVLFELPAGKIDKGENLKECAGRELLEETGYYAEELEQSILFYPCPGYSDERMYLFIAKELTLKQQELDHDEFIEPVRMSFKEALNMANEGEIRDMKTIASLFLARKWI